MSDQYETWISANEAGEILRMSPRQVRRYAEGDPPRLRSKRSGNRVLVMRSDVLQLATEVDALNKPKPTRAEIIPPGELLGLITRKDDEIRGLQDELKRTAMVLGQYRAEAEAGRRYLEDKERLQRQLDELEARARQAEQEREEMRAELERLRTASRTESDNDRPWWRRLFS